MNGVLAAFAIADEASLIDYCRLLDQDDRKELLERLREFLGMSAEQLDAQLLRILIERARPLLISQRTWSQAIGSSDPVRSAIESHITSVLGISKEEIPVETMATLESIASNFREPRANLKITADLLERTGYRCKCCGFLFRDQDLEDFDLELPDSQKAVVAAGPRIDPFHPIAKSDQLAKPRSDHIWPVSLYGSNTEDNITVLCDACNSGKQNYMSYAHSAPNVGVFLPKYFLSQYVDPIVFFSVLARDEICMSCGIGPDQRPLTVRKRILDGILVPDNLRTVCYFCANAD